jgi:phosphoserine aminotransferase
VPVPTDIRIPADLLPSDGRFGSGPSRVRPEAARALAAAADGYLGTSHRRSGVKSVVGRLRAGIRGLFALPDDWEVVLGNGGTSAFWDAAACSLIESRSFHLAFGEFSSRFASVTAGAPHLGEPEVESSDPGTRPEARAVAGVDAYCFTHNETSTGVCAPVTRPAGADEGSLVLVDATSAAGGIEVDLVDGVDVYYFAPQKVLAADGGLWLAAMSPAALDRARRLTTDRPGGRWVPPFLDLAKAAEESSKDQTVNTPALATIFLATDQVEWINQSGGLAWAAKRCAEASGHLYDWAEKSDFASPFVAEPDERSPVTVTIDLDDSVPADDLCAALRANGIVDLEGYRKLGRNQIRVATFPATPPSDAEALTACLDFVAPHLAG